MIGRLVDAAISITYRGNGFYQLGNCVISDDVQLLKYIHKWMDESLLGPVEGFPVYLSKGGINSSHGFIIGDYDHRTHNFSVQDDEGKYYRVKLIAKFNSIPATILIYKEGWQAIKCFRPYRESKSVHVPKKEQTNVILFPMMKEISYAEYLNSVKAEFCAVRNMGDKPAKEFVQSLTHFNEK
jgi:hypothetical protein